MRRHYIAIVLAVPLLAVGAYELSNHYSSSASDPIAAIGGTAMSLRIDGLPHYLQNDPRWADMRIGGSNEQLAHVGCTLACVSMGLAKFGYAIDPLQLCKALNDQDGFTESGLLKWEKIEDVTDGKVTVAFPQLSHENIEAELKNGHPVIAKIMLSEKIPHWVLIVGKDRNDYLIMDPLNSQKDFTNLSERSQRIYAIRVLQKQDTA